MWRQEYAIRLGLSLLPASSADIAKARAALPQPRKALGRCTGAPPAAIKSRRAREHPTRTCRSGVSADHLRPQSGRTAHVGRASDAHRVDRGGSALRSRVLLYRQDWAGADAAADATLGHGYQLAASFPDLFEATGNSTPEDIWRASFTATEYNPIGFYYVSKSFGGRRELAPTADLAAAFEPNDQRGTWSIKRDPSNRRYGAKFPTTEGAEDLHIIRLGEVLLNKAEAQARQNKL